MKRLSILPYFIYLFASVLFACTTGKNALQKGDYDASIGKAVNRLQNAPKNAEAAEVLKTAYNLSYQDHLRRINEAKMARGPFYWETVLYAYQKINQTADLINACPAC